MVTELNYHPSDPTTAEQAAGFTDANDFEFIELMNISAGAIDLSGSRFTAGIDFIFPLNSILSPGQRTIIVSSRAGFAVRYPGIPYASIAGEYRHDRLDNAGELVRLESATGSLLLAFAYGTSGVWPAEADGAGRSLVLIKPSAAANLNAPLSWRASSAAHGTPLESDAVGYAAWKAANAILSDSIDTDADGIPPLVEYAAGTDPAVASLERLPEITRDSNGDWRFNVTRALRSDDADFVIQATTDPAVWTDAAVTIESRIVSGDVETFACRLSNPAEVGRLFVRARWVLRP